MSRPIAGRYRLVETIGGGGTSIVHRAQIAGGLPDVAVKQLRPQFAVDPALRRRFLREAELARTLDHAGVVRVLDAGEDEGVPFLVLELMHGQTLRTRLDQEQRLPPSAAWPIFISLARALGHAHGKGVIHRDVKPENVFLTPSGVKLGDFGNARVASLASVTGASLTWGTPEYVAPEVFMRGRADPRSDLYSLGVLLHEMLAGKLPWSRSQVLTRLAGNGSATAPPPTGAGEEVDNLLGRLLAYAVADRPASADEVLARVAHPKGNAIEPAAKCASCGAARASDVSRCLACGHEAMRFAHDPAGEWQLVLEKLEDDPAATERFLRVLDPIAKPPEKQLQFVTGKRDQYSDIELQTAISMPAVLFSHLDAGAARSLETVFRREGLDVRVVEGNSSLHTLRRVLGLVPTRRWVVMIAGFAPLLGLWLMLPHRFGPFFPALVGGTLLTLLGSLVGKVWKEHKKRVGRAVFELREQLEVGPLAEAVLTGAAGMVGAVRAPEVRALLGDVAIELYRLTRRAEQLGAKSAGPSSEADLLRRTADAAPALLERLRRMATRLDDLDAALEGQTEGELMQTLARLERGAAIPGADRVALAATRRDVEATLERRHAVEQERARLSARLCQLLGQLRIAYREAAAMETTADREACALEAASAELDALLVAPA